MKLGVPKEPEGETRVGIVPSSMKKRRQDSRSSSKVQDTPPTTMMRNTRQLVPPLSLEPKHWLVRTLFASVSLVLMASQQGQTWRVSPIRSATQNTSRPAWTPASHSSRWTGFHDAFLVQSMDVNSSQDNLAGYKAVLLEPLKAKGYPDEDDLGRYYSSKQARIVAASVAGLHIATAVDLASWFASMFRSTQIDDRRRTLH